MAKLENGEFVVMLPGSTLSEAAAWSSGCAQSTANCVLPLVDRELQIRFRHGVAELKPNETAQELIARARAETAIRREPRASQPAAVTSTRLAALPFGRSLHELV